MKPSSRNKNYSIVLIVVVVLFVLIKFIVFPLLDKVSEQRTSITFKEQSLEKYVKAVKTKGSLQLKLRKLKKESRKRTSSFLKGETPSLSAADLQKIIDGIAEENGVKIKSVKVLDSIQQKGLTAIPIQTMFNCDLTMLEKFTSSIENNKKLLTIPELKIRVKNKRKPAGISVTMIITGFVQNKNTDK
jgi:Tfp pilus assembly protein PilO